MCESEMQSDLTLIPDFKIDVSKIKRSIGRGCKLILKSFGGDNVQI